MKFEINFNRKGNRDTLELIGAKPIIDFDTDMRTYYIEVDTFEQLERMLSTVDLVEEGIYSAVVSFDPPTIFLDDNI